MIQIRPVSNLRNKYPKIEQLVVKEDQTVFLTCLQKKSPPSILKIRRG